MRFLMSSHSNKSSESFTNLLLSMLLDRNRVLKINIESRL